MKAIVLYNQNTGKLEIVGHDLDDDQASELVNSYASSGKEAYLIDQLRPHGGRANKCAKCQSAGEKLFSGTLKKEESKPPEMEVSPLSLGTSSVSLNITEESVLEERIKPYKSRIITSLVVVFIIVTTISLIVILGKIPKKETITQIIIPSAPPLPTATPVPVTPYFSTPPTKTPAPTLHPPLTNTRTRIPTRTHTVPPPTPTRSCIPALEITLNEVGQRLCVTGTVIRTFIQENLLYIVFSDQRGKFYMYANDPNRKDITTGMCIRFTGVVKKLGNSPIILIDINDKVLPCE